MTTRRLLLLLVLPLAAACGSGGGKAPEAVPATTTAAKVQAVTVHLVYHSQSGDGSGIAQYTNEDGVPCVPYGSGGLDFMNEGAVATIKSGTGDILGTGDISGGLTSNVVEDETGSADYDCTWDVDFGDVDAAKFYVVTIAGHEMGTFPVSDITGGEATIDLAVG